MKKILCEVSFVALGAMALSACDAPAPENFIARPRASAEITPGETLADIVRNALADVLRDPDAFSRARRLGSLLPTLGPAGVPAVEETLEDMALDLGATELELLVRYWATHAPEDASYWALKRSSPLYRTAAVHSALIVWAQLDPLAAASASDGWVEADPSLSTAVPIALVRGWFAADDRSELAQYIYDLKAGFYQQRAIATYARASIQAEGYDEVERWAQSLPDDDKPYKLSVFRQVASALPLFDHDAAMRFCDAHCTGPYGNNLRSLIARRWVVHDGPGAMAWLSTGPVEKETDLAVRVTYALWGRRDREAALRWMDAEATEGLKPWLQPILSVYALLVAEEEPENAIEWANGIGSDADRETVLVLVARAWRDVDAAAAEAWLLQSSLSGEARERARRSLGDAP